MGRGQKFKKIEKHGLSFFEAQRAFLDPNRVILRDDRHSSNEARFFCLGKVDDRGVDFFKKKAKQLGVPYQTMIKQVLDLYSVRYSKA